MSDVSDESAAGGRPGRAPLPDAWWKLPVQTRRLITVGLLGVLFIVFVVVAASSGSDEPDPVEYVAELPPDRVATWDSLAECESEGSWNSDTGNGFFGGLQFTLASWEEVNGRGSPANASREEQIMRAEFLYQKQGWDAWPSCSVELELQ